MLKKLKVKISKYSSFIADVEYDNSLKIIKYDLNLGDYSLSKAIKVLIFFKEHDDKYLIDLLKIEIQKDRKIKLKKLKNDQRINITS